MTRLKLIFIQTLTISTGIFFGLGLQAAIRFLRYGQDYASFTWQWYTPLAIILVGFLCAVPTVLLSNAMEAGAKKTGLRIALHFLCVLAILSACGALLKWYDGLADYAAIFLMYLLIYAFVWLSSLWIGKADEKKINKVLEEYRDEE